jgi:putative transposase
MGTARYVYNRALEHVRANPADKSNWKLLTSLFVTKRTRGGVFNDRVPAWTFKTPKDIRKEMVRDLTKAFETAFSNLKRGHISHFKLGFKRKRKSSSIAIPDEGLKLSGDKLTIYPTYQLGAIKVARRELKRPISLNHTCRLQYVRGQWFLCVPYKKPSRVRAPPQKSVCAVDPGVRTFGVVFSPEEVTKIQQNQERLDSLHAKLDKLRALRAKAAIRPSSFQRAWNRVHRKIDNLTTDLHYRAISYLKTFKHILLPSFETQEMVSKRCLSSRSNRRMLGLRHYLFQTRLKHSLELDSHSNVSIVTEEYTSKTCSHCGRLGIPTRDKFECASCGLQIDRDINGARNILLKHLLNI